MFRKVIIMLMVVMVLGIWGYLSVSAQPPFKIGVVTGTVAQGEDEFRGAEMMSQKYPGMIIHRTYPDRFMAEQETTIAQITGLAADPNVKAIVICQAVPGSIAALTKVKEKRPEMIFIFAVPHEDPKLVAKYPELALRTNDLKRGESIPRLAKRLGAKTFIHYSFPRHMAMAFLAQRRQVMEEECKKLGIQFKFVTAPDPLGEGGLPAAQQFILEDVPRQVAIHGKETAFFSTNCGMQEPLIKASLEAGAIFPEQCCPSPTHGYPAALGLKIPAERKGDIPYILDQIKAGVQAKGGSGRFATWPAPINMVFLKASVELAKQAVEGKVNLKDAAMVRAELEKAAGMPMASIENPEGNLLLVLSESIIF